ncbi:hypothetical protein, partial [Fructilactobacillus florum]
GFQGMAVAPYKHGKPDYHNVQIAIAGTNFDDIKDVITDATQIPESRTIIGPSAYVYGIVSNALDHSQFTSADRFYNETVNKLESKGFSASDIKHGTGHSLGGALIFYLAAKHHFSMTTFSSADPRSNLNDADLAYIKNHPEMFKDYYHKSDIIANWQMIAQLGKAFSVNEFSSKYGKGIMGMINGHFIDSYHFEKKTGQVDTDVFNTFDIELSSIQEEYKRLKSSGALTNADEIMLDASVATELTIAIRDVAKEILDEIIKKLHKVVREQEKYWQEVKEKSMMVSSQLSPDELIHCLNEGGANYQSMVGKYKEDANQRITKAKDLKNKFEEWASKVQQGIEKVVQRDSELAKDFNI